MKAPQHCRDFRFRVVAREGTVRSSSTIQSASHQRQTELFSSRIKIISIIPCVTLVSSLIIGCGNPAYNSGDLRSYRSAIRSGRVAIKPALEIEKQFPKTEHIIIMYGGTGSDIHEWQTVSFFGGRYQLTMTQNVMLSPNGTKVLQLIGQPIFQLLKCEKVTADGGANYSGDLTIDIEKWNSFRNSKFDLKIIDPNWDGSVLVDFDAFADKVQANRKVWR